MAITKHNSRKATKYPQRYNQRENKASTSNYSATSVNAENIELSADDAANFIKLETAQECKLPPAAESKGRLITVFTNAAGSTVVPFDGDDLEGVQDDTVTLDGAGEWADFFCTGSDWLIVRSGLDTTT